MKNNLFVFDTNVLISASLFNSSASKSAVSKATGIGRVTSSIDSYKEFLEVFLRPKFDKFITIETRLEILIEFKRITIFFDPTETISICRDPKDNKFLELAVAAKASCIITGDNDLLALHPFRGIPILSPADFINNFRI